MIKTDPKLSAPPHTGQKVRLDGKADIYVVLRVDAEKHVADLLCTKGNHTVMEGVFFDKLRAVSTGIADALDHLLKSA